MQVIDRIKSNSISNSSPILILHADNCAGQNKNCYTIWFLNWLVLNDFFKRVELRFLVAGHTKKLFAIVHSNTLSVHFVELKFCIREKCMISLTIVSRHKFVFQVTMLSGRLGNEFWIVSLTFKKILRYQTIMFLCLTETILAVLMLRRLRILQTGIDFVY